MDPKYNYQKAMPTPCGKADYKQEVYNAGGSRVWEVGTPSHGGLMMSKRLTKLMLTAQGYKIGMEWGNRLWLEEDCGWAVFAYESPNVYCEYVKKSSRMPAKNTRRWEARPTGRNQPKEHCSGITRRTLVEA
jgi:hypothetical protein